MASPDTTRKSGSTQGEEVTASESKKNDEAEQPHEAAELATESPRSIFRAPGFHRMRFGWSGEDGRIVAQAQRTVEERVQAVFKDAFQIMYELFEIVREKEYQEGSGEVITDEFGWPMWRRTESGGWVEDWSALTRAQKENFLFQITTRLFAWEMRAAEAWGEAMFAKAEWEERFSIDYHAPVTGTIDDRTAKGRMGAAEERYFAIFQTLYSKKADSIVRVMTLLSQRLKDTLDLG